MSTAFLITPFSPERAGGEKSQVYEAVQEAIAHAVASAGLELVHPKEMFAAGPITDQIRRAIDEADVVLAILTGNNPNVFLELGWADSARSILVCENAKDLPFDVRHLRVLTYGSDADLSTLARRVEEAIRATTAENSKKRQRLALNRPNYRAEIEHVVSYRTEVFVGREEDISMVARFSCERAPLYLLVTGAAGCGKSALVSELIRRHEQGPWPMDAKPRLLYVFIRQQGGANRPIDFLRALNSQMLTLLGSDEGVPSDLPAMETQFTWLWTASQQLSREKEPLLLLVDGLDEAPTQKDTDITRYLPSKLSDYVHVVVTSRPAPDPRSRVDLGHPLRAARLHELGVFTANEIEQLLRSFGANPQQVAELTTRVLTATKGLPLLARFVSKDAMVDVNRLDELERNPPTDVRDYFVKQFEHLDEIAETKETVWPVFKTLAVGFGAMTSDDLAGVLGWNKNQLSKAIGAGQRFLVPSREGWELMHVELRRVLEERQFSSRELDGARQEIIAWCKSYHKDDWPSSTPMYVLRYFLRHLSQQEDDRGILEACVSGYLEVKLERLLSAGAFDDDYLLLLRACSRLRDSAGLYHWTMKRARLADEVAVLSRLEESLDSVGRLLLSRRSDAWRRWVALYVLGQKPIGLLNLCASLTPPHDDPPEEIFEMAEAVLLTFPVGEKRDEMTARLVRELSRWGKKHLDRARELCDTIGQPDLRASAYVTIATGYARAGQTPEAATCLGLGLDEAERVVRKRAAPFEWKISVVSTFINISEALLTIGGENEARVGLERVVSLSSLLEDAEDASKIVAAASHGFATLGDLSRAMELLLQMFETGQPSRFGSITPMETVNAIVKCSFATASRTHTLDICDRLLEAVEHVNGDIWLRADLLAALAHGYARCGDMEKSSVVLERAVAHTAPSEFHGDSLSACVDAYSGLPAEEARACLDRVRAALEGVSETRSRARCAAILARGYVKSGQGDIARDLLDRELRKSDEARNQLDISWTLSHLATGYANLRDLETARGRLESVLEKGAYLTDSVSVSQLFSHISNEFVRLGIPDTAQAIDELQELIAGELSSTDNRPEVYCSAAAVFAGSGDVDRATWNLYQGARSAADSGGFAVFGLRLKWVFENFQNPNAAARILERLPTILVDCANAPAAAQMLLAFARSHDDAPRTRAMIDRARQTASQVSSEAARCHVLCDIARTCDRLHLSELATAALVDAEREALQIKQSFRSAYERRDAITDLARVVEELEDDELATKVLIRLVRIVVDTRLAEDDTPYARTLRSLAHACAKRKRSDEVMDVVEMLQRMASRMTDGFERSRTLVAVADASNRHAGSARARETLVRIGGALDDIADLWSRAEVMALMASSYVGVGDSSTALTLLRHALELLLPETGMGYEGPACLAAACAIVRVYGSLDDETQAIAGLSRVLSLADRKYKDARVVLEEIAKSHSTILARARYARILEAWDAAAPPEPMALSMLAPVHWRLGDRKKAIELLSKSVRELTLIPELERRRSWLFLVARGAAEIRGYVGASADLTTLLQALTRIAEESSCPDALALVGRAYVNIESIDDALALLPKMAHANAFTDLCTSLSSATALTDRSEDVFHEILMAAAPKGSPILLPVIEDALARIPGLRSRPNLDLMDTEFTGLYETVRAIPHDGASTLVPGAVGAARAAILTNAPRYEEASRQYAKAAETYELQHAQSCVFWGLSLAQLGLHAQAIEKYQKAASRNPQDGRTQVLWGVSESALGNQGEAAERYRAAIELLPEQTRSAAAAYLFDTGMKMFESGDYSNAERAFGEAGMHLADEASCSFWRGVSRYNLGNYLAAEEDFSHSIEKNPTHAMAWYMRGRSRFSLGRHAEAEADLTHQIERQSATAEAYYWRGVVRYAQHADEGAESDFTSAIERGYGDSVYALRGEIRARRGNFADAEQDFSTAIERKPGNARLHLSRGRVLLKLNKVAEAERDLTVAIEAGVEDSIAAHCDRGVARFFLERYAAAEEDLQRAAALGAEDPGIDYWLGVSQLEQGKLVKAQSDLTAAIEHGLADPHGFFVRGVSRALLGDHRGAECDFNAAVAQGMDGAELYRWRSYVRVHLGALSAAGEDCAAVEARAPDSSDAHRSRGYIKLAALAFDEAVAAYRSALGTDTAADVRFELGLALLLALEFEAAEATYADAASRASSNDLRYAIDELEYWTGRYSDRLSSSRSRSALTSIRSILTHASSARE